MERWVYVNLSRTGRVKAPYSAAKLLSDCAPVGQKITGRGLKWLAKVLGYTIAIDDGTYIETVNVDRLIDDRRYTVMDVGEKMIYIKAA